jgi:large subunit ribosomal protein L10
LTKIKDLPVIPTMAVTHQKKVDIVRELQESVATQKTCVLLSTRNTDDTVNSTANFELRFSARKDGVVVRVVKNTLIKIVYPQAPDLVGQTYLAYLENPQSGDEVTVPKVIVDLVKAKFETKFNVLGSVVNGEFLDTIQTKKLSNTPSFTQSMASLAGTLNQFASKIAVGVKEIPSSIARGVNAMSAK